MISPYRIFPTMHLPSLLLLITLFISTRARAQADSPYANFANLERYRTANETLPPPTADEQRVVFLGNSITEGWARKDPAFFADNKFIGRGISGQTSPQLLLRFRQDVIELNPAAVVIHIGTNDVAENTGPYDPDFTIGNIISMVELARANNITPILAAVLPATGFRWRTELGDRSNTIIELNRRLAEYAEAEGIPFVDYHAALANAAGGMDPELAEDGVHPTERGYTIMREMVLPIIALIRE